MLGVGVTREAIFISHIATDDDGSLKILKIEDFPDSKAHTEWVSALARAMPTQQ
jgi:hypothetical protein